MHLTRINAKELGAVLNSTNESLIVIFTASWCGYCRSLSRELENSPPGFNALEVDISNEKDRAWDEYEINVVPTALLFKGSKELGRVAAGVEGLRGRDLKALYDSHA